jgi:hypothetical protein
VQMYSVLSESPPSTPVNKVATLFKCTLAVLTDRSILQGDEIFVDSFINWGLTWLK